MAQPLAGRRCLVLDDEFLIALDIQQVLEQAGAGEVVCAGNVAEALTAIRTERFDLAVLDLRVGRDGNSLPAAEALAAAGTPFLFLTGMRTDVAEVHGYPDTPVVEKPYDSSTLLAAIRRLVEQRP